MAAALLVALGAVLGGDWTAAQADRDSFPPDARPYLYYATAEHVPDPEARRAALTAFRYAMFNFCPQPVAHRAAPVVVSETLVRFDVRDLEVTPEDWAAIVSRDPYRPVALPMMSRADWLAVQLCDASESDAFYRVAFGGKPKDRDALLLSLGVNLDEAYQFGQIESDSGVSVKKRRLISSLPMLRGVALGTRDSASLQAHKDPLEQLENDFEHDAEEWLIYRPVTANGQRGVKQFGFLADGKGKLLEVADTQVVVDHLNFRGTPDIRAPGGCIGCHSTGPIDPKHNALAEQVAAGVERFAYLSADIERFHFGDLQTELERTREDFRVGCIAGLGLWPAEGAASIKQAIARYDEDVDLERLAQEHFVTAEQLQRALALESGAGANMPASVVALPHGGKMDREAVEEAHEAVELVIGKWLKQ